VASQCGGTAGLLVRGLPRGVAKPDSVTVKNECDLTEPAWLARRHVTVHHHMTRQVANIPLQLQLQLDRECMHVKLIIVYFNSLSINILFLRFVSVGSRSSLLSEVICRSFIQACVTNLTIALSKLCHLS